MLATVTSAGVYGIDAVLVEVEVDVGKGVPRFVIVGLPDAAVKESLDRVTTSLRNSGYPFKSGRLVVNLAPADLRKEGPSFDLPIAVGMLIATQQILCMNLEEYLIVGELALDGRVRSVKGCLPMAIEAKEQGLRGIILSKDNAAEASVVTGLDVIPVETLVDAVGFLTGQAPIEPRRTDVRKLFQQSLSSYDLNFSEVKGQDHAKRALTVAAAGGHNTLMIGPPGAGKTMLAQRLPSVLPLLSLEESLETTKVHSVAGLLGPTDSLVATRPFRAPHHTVSDAGLVGGGTYPRPGEVSLSHNGVLFLDEFPEFNRHTLEVLRQPLEDGTVTIARAKMSTKFPARIMLVAAMNPCPCGYYGDPRRECRCSPGQIQRYMSRISGPLLDRIDIHIEVPAPPYRELRSDLPSVSSDEIREQVMAARRLQEERFAGDAIFTNANMPSRLIKQHCRLTNEAESILKQAMTSLALSARAYTKILKVGRTIADLDGNQKLQAPHIAEAIQLRRLDRGGLI
ncbi:MAG: YifB family Mg chelatase-like AAA ATPase [Planctomycetes bacterium]|nr:YifB family Mg chelatase-like AAA ATPase [Planctomycetota bacterium]